MLPEELATEILDLVGEVGRMLHALIGALERGKTRVASLAPST
jgi:hypothetical protein